MCIRDSIWHELSRLPAKGETVSLFGGPAGLRVDEIDGNAIERVSFDVSGGAK